MRLQLIEPIEKLDEMYGPVKATITRKGTHIKLAGIIRCSINSEGHLNIDLEVRVDHNGKDKLVFVSNGVTPQVIKLDAEVPTVLKFNTVTLTNMEASLVKENIKRILEEYVSICLREILFDDFILSLFFSQKECIERAMINTSR